MKQRFAAVILCLVLTLTGLGCSSDELPGVGTGPEKPDTEPSVTDLPADTVTDADIPDMPEDVRLSFVAAGDNVIHPGIYMEAAERAAGSASAYDFKPMYKEIAERIASADIAFINQETLMAGEDFGYSGYPLFNSPQELGLDLETLGFDIVNIANNHMLDKHEDGLASTIQFWKNRNVTMIGGYENEEDYNSVRILEREGVKIALLSYTYGTNSLTLPASSPMVIPYLNDEDIIRQTARAREEADLVFVSVHWGEENLFATVSEQEHYAQLMADCGVDVIIGHHPHVIQKIEWLEREDGSRTLCIYSLGNLLSMMAKGYNMLGGLMTFDIVRENGKIFIENPVFLPTVFHYNQRFRETCVYYLEDYTDELASKHGVQRYGNTLSITELENYLTQYIDAEFLPDADR